MDWTLLGWEVVLKYIQNQKASKPKVFLPWRGAIFVQKIKVAVGNELASVDPRLDRPEAAEDTDLLVQFYNIDSMHIDIHIIHCSEKVKHTKFKWKTVFEGLFLNVF